MIRPNTPWFNEDIRAAKSKKRDLEHKWRKSKLEIDRQLYREQRQVVKHMIEDAKTDYYSASVDKCDGDQKSLYGVVNNLLHKKKEPVLPSRSSDHDLANRFSDYFVGKIDNIRSSFNDQCEIPSNSSGNVTRIIEFEPATDEEVMQILVKSPSSTCELDPIPTWLIKECANDIVPFLTCIINKSLDTGIFPSECKLAYIRPLLKKSGLEKEDLKNYRPVANLSFLGKLIERVVSSRLWSVITEYNLQDPFQSAYRANHSTETALIRVQNDILREMDNGRITSLVLLDLSAAFDTVDHGILLQRLEHNIGIGGVALQWCDSYLRNRKQCVRVGESSSEAVTLNYSVPQGSVLGPQWFVIYTTPLRDIFLKHGLHYQEFADDTQLYSSFEPHQDAAIDCISKMEACVEETRQWMKCNYLKLNDNKTEFILIGSKHNLNKISIPFMNIGDSTVAPVSQVRNLGIIMDNTMTLVSHISSVVKAASFQLRNLGKIRKFLTPEATEQLVHAFITSRLDMGNALLSGLPLDQIHRLQLKQNTAARLITRTRPSDHISSVLIDLHWLPIRFRIQYKLMLLTYRAINGLAPPYVTDLLTSYAPSRSGLRSANKALLFEPKSSRSWGDRAFSIAAPRLWNSLPDSLRRSSSIESFKSSLKTYLFQLAHNHD